MSHAGLGNGWALAIAAMTLQTVRHMTDTWYGVLHDEAARRPRAAAGAGGGIGDRLNAASTRVQADTGSVSYWLKRTVVFPIGERWALIALTVALFNPLVSLIAVLVWGVLAFAYTGALRTLRARWMRVPVLDTVDATLHRDDGPLARWLPVVRPMGPLALAVVAALGPAVLLVAALLAATRRTGCAGRCRWRCWCCWSAAWARGRRTTVRWTGWCPAALRAAEYLFAIAVGVVGGAPRLADLRVRLRAHRAPLRPDGPAGEAAGGTAAARVHAGLGGALGAAGPRGDCRHCGYRAGYTRCVPSRGFRGERRPGLVRATGP